MCPVLAHDSRSFRAGVCGVYSETPAARNASARSKYARVRQTLLFRKSRMFHIGASTRAPLLLPRPVSRLITTTQSLRSRNSSATEWNSSQFSSVSA